MKVIHAHCGIQAQLNRVDENMGLTHRSGGLLRGGTARVDIFEWSAKREWR